MDTARFFMETRMGRKSRRKPGPVSRQVEYAHNLVGFLVRYFPAFMTSIFMCIFSIATATAVITQTYFRDDLDNGSYSALFIMAASVILTVGGFLDRKSTRLNSSHWE